MQKVESVLCVWNDGSGSLFTEEIPEDELVPVTDPRYLGEYRGPGWLTRGWLDGASMWEDFE